MSNLQRKLILDYYDKQEIFVPKIPSYNIIDLAKAIAPNAKIKYVSNKCIKQEYQKLFQKSNPVFPVLR